MQAGGFCVGMLSLVCSVRFSCGPPLLLFGVLLSSARIPLWLSCLHCVGWQHFGEWEGLSEQGLGCFRFHASLVVLRVLPGVGAGSEARGEGRSFLRMRLRLLYSFCVVICWGRARRARRSGQAGCSSDSINAPGTPSSDKVGVLSSSAIFLEWHEHNVACSRRSKR